MKYTGILLCSFMLFIFSSSATPVRSNFKINKGYYASGAVGFDPNDSTPNLFQRIAEVFKFKKYSNIKEKERVIGIIQEMALKDTIDATKGNLHLLDSVLDKVRKKGDTNFVMLQHKTDSLSRVVYKANDSIYKQLTELAKPPSDEEITELADKILPIIQNKIMRSQKLAGYAAGDSSSLIKTVSYYTNLRSDSSTFQVNRKADVFCFCSNSLNKNYLDFNFSIINTMIFDGYDLADKNAYNICSNNLENNRVLKTAVENKCTVLLSLFSSGTTAINAMLIDSAKQQELITNLSSIMAANSIDGVNVMLKDLNYNSSDAFVSFIQLLTQKINLVTVTLPAFDINNGYDVEALNKLPVKKFILDFSNFKNEGINGPVIALDGSKFSMQAAANRFLNSPVPFQKLILALPVYGVEFSYNPQNSIVYKTIDNLSGSYADSSYYDTIAASVYKGSTDLNGNVIKETWYDDAETLKDKYKFILNNGFSGIAIEPLSRTLSIGYSNIWNGLAGIFFTVSQKPLNIIADADSCLCGYDQHNDSIVRSLMTKLGTSNCFGLIRSEKQAMNKFIYLVLKPCPCKFEDTGNSSNNFFDSLAKISLQKNDSLYYNTYFIRGSLNNGFNIAAAEKNKMYLIAYRAAVKKAMLYISLLLALLFTGLLIFYFNGTREYGQEWKWRKQSEIASDAVLGLLVLSASLFFYLSDHYVVTEGNVTCQQVPPYFFLAIILVIILAGIAAMHYKIFSSMRSKDEP